MNYRVNFLSRSVWNLSSHWPGANDYATGALGKAA